MPCKLLLIIIIILYLILFISIIVCSVSSSEFFVLSLVYVKRLKQFLVRTSILGF